MLPGKLSIGFLQEDNPLKFFFRIRPLVVQAEQGYTLIENTTENFPDGGYIRIVPDKNEITQFKSRMRALGRYCVMDLRRHIGENDKIRPNKNYGGSYGDRNFYIVYSDVIDKTSDAKVAEVIHTQEPAEGLVIDRPGTTFIMLRRETKISGPYGWEPVGETRARIEIREDVPPVEIELHDAAGYLFPVIIEEAQTVELLIDLDQFGIVIPEKESAPDYAAPAPVYQASVAPAIRENPTQAHATEPAATEAQTISTDLSMAAPEAAQPIAAAALMDAPAASVEEIETAPDAAPDLAAEAKPWMLPSPHAASRPGGSKAINARLHPRQHSLQMQSGVNPTRGRSIQDIIDEQWRQSRYDQLGHPVPPEATTRPVPSPIERAASALKEVWALPDVRERMLSEIHSITGIPAPAQSDTAADDLIEKQRYTQSLEQLEADRIRLTTEIDRLKDRRRETREQLVDELHRANIEQIRQSEKRVAQLRTEIEKDEQAAVVARGNAQAAEQAAERFMQELDNKLLDQLAGNRAGDLMLGMSYGQRARLSVPPIQNPSAGELISDLRIRFEAADMPLTNDQAVNLLACLLLGRVAVLSGPVGSGKSESARIVADALGLTPVGRYAEIKAGAEWTRLGEQIVSTSINGAPIVRMPDVRLLLTVSDRSTPLMLMIDDANQALIEQYAGELIELSDAGAPMALTTGNVPLPIPELMHTVMTIQDDAAPLSAKLLDRAFFVRLPQAPCAAPLKAAAPHIPAADKAVSAEAIAQIFSAEREIPGEVLHRLQRLREQLAEYGIAISRRALSGIHRYLSCAAPLMRCTPMEALDWAIAQRALPAILASANLPALHALPDLLDGFPRCMELMDQPLPLPAL